MMNYLEVKICSAMIYGFRNLNKLIFDHSKNLRNCTNSSLNPNLQKKVFKQICFHRLNKKDCPKDVQKALLFNIIVTCLFLRL